MAQKTVQVREEILFQAFHSSKRPQKDGKLFPRVTTGDEEESLINAVCTANNIAELIAAYIKLSLYWQDKENRGAHIRALKAHVLMICQGAGVVLDKNGIGLKKLGHIIRAINAFAVSNGQHISDKSVYRQVTAHCLTPLPRLEVGDQRSSWRPARLISWVTQAFSRRSSPQAKQAPAAAPPPKKQNKFFSHMRAIWRRVRGLRPKPGQANLLLLSKCRKAGVDASDTIDQVELEADEAPPPSHHHDYRPLAPPEIERNPFLELRDENHSDDRAQVPGEGFVFDNRGAAANGDEATHPANNASAWLRVLDASLLDRTNEVTRLYLAHVAYNACVYGTYELIQNPPDNIQLRGPAAKLFIKARKAISEGGPLRYVIEEAQAPEGGEHFALFTDSDGVNRTSGHYVFNSAGYMSLVILSNTLAGSTPEFLTPYQIGFPLALNHVTCLRTGEFSDPIAQAANAANSQPQNNNVFPYPSARHKAAILFILQFIEAQQNKNQIVCFLLLELVQKLYDAGTRSFLVVLKEFFLWFNPLGLQGQTLNILQEIGLYIIYQFSFFCANPENVSVNIDPRFPCCLPTAAMPEAKERFFAETKMLRLRIAGSPPRIIGEPENALQGSIERLAVRLKIKPDEVSLPWAEAFTTIGHDGYGTFIACGQYFINNSHGCATFPQDVNNLCYILIGYIYTCFILQSTNTVRGLQGSPNKVHHVRPDSGVTQAMVYNFLRAILAGGDFLEICIQYTALINAAPIIRKSVIATILLSKTPLTPPWAHDQQGHSGQMIWPRDFTLDLAPGSGAEAPQRAVTPPSAESRVIVPSSAASLEAMTLALSNNPAASRETILSMILRALLLRINEEESKGRSPISGIKKRLSDGRQGPAERLADRVVALWSLWHSIAVDGLDYRTAANKVLKQMSNDPLSSKKVTLFVKCVGNLTERPSRPTVQNPAFSPEITAQIQDGFFGLMLNLDMPFVRRVLLVRLRAFVLDQTSKKSAPAVNAAIKAMYLLCYTGLPIAVIAAPLLTMGNHALQKITERAFIEEDIPFQPKSLETLPPIDGALPSPPAHLSCFTIGEIRGLRLIDTTGSEEVAALTDQVNFSDALTVGPCALSNNGIKTFSYYSHRAEHGGIAPPRMDDLSRLPPSISSSMLHAWLEAFFVAACQAQINIRLKLLRLVSTLLRTLVDHPTSLATLIQQFLAQKDLPASFRNLLTSLKKTNIVVSTRPANVSPAPRFMVLNKLYRAGRLETFLQLEVMLKDCLEKLSGVSESAAVFRARLSGIAIQLLDFIYRITMTQEPIDTISTDLHAQYPKVFNQAPRRDAPFEPVRSDEAIFSAPIVELLHLTTNPAEGSPLSAFIHAQMPPQTNGPGRMAAIHTSVAREGGGAHEHPRGWARAAGVPANATDLTISPARSAAPGKSADEPEGAGNPPVARNLFGAFALVGGGAMEEARLANPVVSSDSEEEDAGPPAARNPSQNSREAASRTSSSDSMPANR